MKLKFIVLLLVSSLATFGQRVPESLESKKLLEIGIGEQPGYVGMTLPFNIENPTETNLRYSVIKEIFNMNNESPLKSSIKVNNISPYDVVINLVYAK
jgi:hypothetical protein